MFDHTNQEYGIRTRVFEDGSSKGPFRAEINCAVTGKLLGGVERCKNADAAETSGLRHAQTFHYSRT